MAKSIEEAAALEWTKDQFTLNDQRDLLDMDTVCGLLSKTYWAADRPRDTIEKVLRTQFPLAYIQMADKSDLREWSPTKLSSPGF